MEALDNKCPACGAKIIFNPKEQKWDCEYCGSKFSLEEMKEYENASNEKANKKTQTLKLKELKDVDVYRCKDCGAEIIADKQTTATFCVYCGNTAILKEKIDDGVAPSLIIPFKNEKDDAIKAFKKVVRKPLTPKCFKDVKNIKKITGVYIPFWTYDLETNGKLGFEAIETKHWSDYNYMYTKIDTYKVETDSHLEYEKVLVDASTRFDDDLMDSLEPFNYNELEPYNHAYLSGFLSEKYDVEEMDAIKRATERVKNTTIKEVQAHVPHHSQILKEDKIKITNNKTDYILLPVWMVNIKYQDKMHTFAMNGQTGKIVGNIPIDKKLATIWSIVIFVIIFAISFAISQII